MVGLTADQAELVREWILEGRADEEIAQVLTVSVKLVRPIRADLEDTLRPR